MAVRHGSWVGIACLSPPLVWDCPRVTAGSGLACLLCSCPCLFLLVAAVLVPIFYWATIVRCALLLLGLIFPLDFVFNVTGAMMIAVFFSPCCNNWYLRRTEIGSPAFLLDCLMYLNLIN